MKPIGNSLAFFRQNFRELAQVRRRYWGLLFLVLATVPLNSRADCQLAPTGLIGWWPGDGNANNVLGTNNGTLQGGATASAAGVVGNAFLFDGTNGFVQIPNSPLLQPTNLTIEAWVRFNSLDSSAGTSGSPAGDQYLVFKQNTRSTDFEGFDLSKTRVAGSDYFRFLVASATGQAVEVLSSSTISTGVWYHVAAVRGANFLQLYVNGSLQRQTNVTFAQSYGTQPLYFGTSGQPSWDRKLYGNLDEVALYNRALASNEVAAIYAAGAAGKCKAPTLTLQPQAQVIVVGSNATFTTAATGFGTLRYQWLLNETPLAGATNSSLTLTNVQLANQGLYAVTVSNSLGSATSASVALVVSAPQSGVPYLSAFNPPAATSGMTVTLSGSNFSATAVNNIVYFGAVRASVDAASPTSLTVTVPVGVTYGPITVTVDGLTGFSGAAFQPTFVGSGAAIGAGTFAARQDLPMTSGSYMTVIADLDGDGKPDLAVGNGYAHTLSVFRNIASVGSLTASSFAAPGVSSLAGSSDGPAGLVGADVDGDGKIDLIVADQSANRVGIFRNLATPGSLTTSSFAAPVYYAVGSVSSRVRVRDLDGDGRPDLVVCNQGGSTISVLKNLSGPGELNAGSFAPAFQLPVNAAPADLTIQDLDGDGKPDLAVVNHGTGLLSLFRNVSLIGELTAGSFAARVDLPTHGSHLTIIAGDIDGDGKPELLAGGQANTLSVFRNLASPGTLGPDSFAAPVDFGLPGWVHNLALSDINGDARPDIVVVGELGSYLAIFQNQSVPGSFTPSSLAARVDYGTGWNAWGVSVGDLDGDGRPDVVFCNTYETFGSLYRNLTPFGSPPTILVQPSNQVATVSNAATFAVTISGPTVANYQWYFNGAALDDTARILGAQTKALTLVNVLPADAGEYLVVVTNFLGGVTSVVAVLTVNPPFCAPAAPGLVGWWSGENNVLDSASTNHGTLLNGSAFVPGKVGAAFNFDGVDDYVQTPTTGLPIGTSDRTIEFWVKIHSFVAEETFIAGYGNLGEDTHFYGLTTKGDQLTFSQWGDALIGPVLTTNGWHHVAVSSVGNSVALYLDGMNVTNGVFAFSTPSDTSLYLGSLSSPYGSNRRLNGQLDEVSVYNRALSAAEIAGIYNAAGLGKCPLPPTFVQSPQSRTNYETQATLLTATVTGTSPLTYQWYFNGAPLANNVRLSGATSNALSIASLLPGDAGNYWLVVSNPVGVVTSVIATLTVNPALCAPAPSGLVGWWTGNGQALDSANTNHGTLLNGAAFAPGQIGQAFSFNGVNGAVDLGGWFTFQTFTLSMWVNPGAAQGDYADILDNFHVANSNWVLQQNSTAQNQYYFAVPLAGTTAYSTFTLAANQWQHLVITRDSTNHNRVYVNGVLAGEAQDAGPVNYSGQSFRVGAHASNARYWNGQLDELTVFDRALSINEVQGIYDASVLGLCLTPPTFVQPLPNLLAVAGGTTVATAPLTGSQPMSQQWFFNGLPLVDNAHIAGSTSTTLVIGNASTNDIGSYFVVATNAVGVSTSSVAQLILGFPPVVSQSPADQTNITGLNAVLTVAATGDPVLGYQWRFNGNHLTNNARFGGLGSASLTVSNLVPGDAGNYDVIVTNGFGSVTSAVAVLTLLQAPTFTVQPVSRLIVPGLPTTFSATVTGPAPLTYQWQFNGTDILDATNTTYTIASVNVTNLGTYRLVASNSIAARTSADALLALGNIAAWGRNDIGQAVVPLTATNVIALAAGLTSSGTAHTLALRADGSVIGWGNNNNGQLNIPAGLSNVVAIAAGGTHSLALRANGTVVAWGNNGNGQLNVPATLSNVIAIAAGGAHSLALRADGKVIGWGYNTYGQAAAPANLNKVVAIAAGLNHSIALRSDGVAINWGFSSDRSQGPAAGAATVIIPLADMTGIAGGNSHSLFLRSNGTVFAIGSNTYGQTNTPVSVTNATAVAAGDYFSMALRDNGTVAVWGRNEYAQTNVPPGVSNVVAIDAGGTDVYALLSDGRPLITQPPVGAVNFVGREQTFRATVTGAAPLSLQWQFNDADLPSATNATLVLSELTLANIGNFRLIASNALGVTACVPVPLTVLDQTNLLMLSQLPPAQTNYLGDKVILTTAVTGNGPLQYQWKFNGTDIPGATNQDLVFDPILLPHAGNYGVAISNQFGGLVSVTSTQRVAMVRTWGYYVDYPYPTASAPLTLTNAIAVAAGYAGYGNSLGHYLALRADGKITMWTTTQSPTAITNIPASLTNATVTAIAGGLNSSIALRSDGIPVNWGSTVYSQSNAPAGVSGITAIAAGDNHFLALRSDGTVATWGIATAGLMNVPASATNIVAVAAGTAHSLALRGNGTVVAWGLGTAGQTNVPPTLTNVIAISAGNQFSAALRADGTVVQWGNGLANYPVPTGLSNIVAIAAGYNHVLALRSDGTLASWGYYYSGGKDMLTPGDLANIIQISAIGDRDIALLGTRAPALTIQPFDRALLRGANTTFIARSVSPQVSSYQWRLNGTDIPSATNATLNLANVQLAQAGAYQLVVSNSYGIAVTRNAKLTVTLPLAEALDTTNVTWLSPNSIPWFGQAAVSHDGVDAARSGSITHSQESQLQTTLTGPAQFSFWWKASSEAGFDTLEFKLDGVAQATISGEVDWEQRSYPIPAGAHTLQWRFAKDASSSGGQDAGWVDQFVYTPAAPVITLQPVSQTAQVGDAVTLRVQATGAGPLIFQWRKDVTNLLGTFVTGGTNSIVTQLTSVGRSHRGVYSVLVSNSGGGTLSSNAVLNVLVPQQFGPPTVLSNGGVWFTSGDVDGGLLTEADLAAFEAQASTNLTDWVTLPNALSLTNGWLLLQEPAQTNHPARFYRVIEH